MSEIKGKRIPIIYCDANGNEYFADVIVIPVMTRDELTQLRTEYAALDCNYFFTVTQGGSGPSPLGSWFMSKFPSSVLDMPTFMGTNFFSRVPTYYSNVNFVFRGHDLSEYIMRHIPYTTDGDKSVIYEFYLKDLDDNIVGPVFLRYVFVQPNDISPNNISSITYSSEHLAFCAFTGAGYVYTNPTYTDSYCAGSFCFYVEDEFGNLNLHWAAPGDVQDSNLDTFSGYFHGNGVVCRGIDSFLPTGPTASLSKWADFLKIASGNVYNPADPYEPGGTSDPTPPGGYIGPQPSDIVEVPDPPSVSFVNGGFCRIYNPDWAQLRALASYLWTDSSFLQTLLNHAKQLLEDPMEAVIALNLIPVPIPQGTPEQVKIMFIPITGVSMPPALRQFVQVDCGSYYLQERYASALDYNPYTKLSLFLPFIGTVSLNPDEVMNHNISIKYNVDIVTGTCVAFVSVDGCVYYQYSGNCAVSMPLNSADFSNWIAASISAGIALAAPVTGAAGVSAAAGTAQTAAVESAEAASSTALTTTGEHALQLYSEAPNLSQAVGSEIAGKAAEFAEFGKKLITNTVGAVAGSKTHFEHTGQFSGFSGFLGQRRPFLILESPKMCNPEEYGVFNGRPSMIYLNLGTLSGYTEVQEIHLTGFSATNPELSEIASLLKAGVIL